MKCEKCVQRISKALDLIDGILEYHVQLYAPQLTVVYDDSLDYAGLVSVYDAILDTVSGLGYGIISSVKYDRADTQLNLLNSYRTDVGEAHCRAFNVAGMVSKTCIEKISNELKEIDRIDDFYVQLEAPQVTIHVVDSANALEAELVSKTVFKTLDELDYNVSVSSLVTSPSEQRERKSQATKRPTALSIEAPAIEEMLNKKQQASSDESHSASKSATDDACKLDPSQPAEPNTNQTPEEASDRNSVSLVIGGMTCASCASKLQKALEAVKGVDHATVNLATETATVYPVDPTADLLADQTLIYAVENAGYRVLKTKRHFSQTTSTELTRSDDSEDALPAISEKREVEAHGWLRRFSIGIILTIVVVALQMSGTTMEKTLTADQFLWTTVGAGVAALLALIFAGAPFFRNALRGLRHANVTMDTLVALGSGAAFAFSAYQTYLLYAAPKSFEVVYFDTAAMIVTLIGLGKWFEARSKRDASLQLESLLQRAPSYANVRRGDWKEVPVEDLKVGELILVKTGEKIAVDGVIQSGEAEIDASNVTGESLPQHRKEGDDVLSGTVLKDGMIQVKVGAIAANSTLARIARQVERAQATKANIQRLADKVASIFVPLVILIAIATYIVWFLQLHSFGGALLPAVAVLVVACPCALGLATPTAMMVGSSWAAKHGIIINNVQALEQARKIDAIIFDKTGTITEGTFTVESKETFADANQDHLWRKVAAIEKLSSHPLADAIVDDIVNKSKHLGKKQSLPRTQSFQNFTGRGVEASVDGQRYRVGKPSWASENATNNDDPKLLTLLEESEKKGETTIVISEIDAISSTVVGVISLKDKIKPTANNVLNSLKKNNIIPWLITGDNTQTATAVAISVGISEDHVMAETLPEDKAKKIQNLHADGHIVAMVGDGVNDAPALATADLSIAMGTGTDVAMETADITLLAGDLALLDAAIAISQATYRKIKQNLFWAFFYNILLIPVAAVGFLNPMFAASAMAISSVFVVTNSLFLRNFKIKSNS